MSILSQFSASHKTGSKWSQLTSKDYEKYNERNTSSHQATRLILNKQQNYAKQSYVQVTIKLQNQVLSWGPDIRLAQSNDW